MEEEELNEEVMGDPDNMREVTDEEKHDEADAGGNTNPEEPGVDIHYAEMEEMRQHIEVLEDKIGGLMDSISTMIESGATVVETTNPMTDGDTDKEEPYLYLEDLDYRM